MKRAKKVMYAEAVKGTLNNMPSIYKLSNIQMPFFRHLAKAAMGAVYMPLLLVEEYKKRGGGKLLDFGCGSGDFSKQEQSRFDEIVLYDPCEEVLQIAAEKLPNAVKVSRLDDLMSIDKSYDVILFITVLQHILVDSELNTVIRYAADHLAQNGLVIILENFNKNGSDYMRTWDVEQLKTLFVENKMELLAAYNFYEHGLFHDSVFRRYIYRPDMYLYYHLYEWCPWLRKPLKRKIQKITQSKRYDEKAKSFLYEMDDSDGDKLLIYSRE